MINLRPDCLVFELSTGEQVPCSAEELALELVLGPGVTLDPEVIRNAAAAVLHYFKAELGRHSVSVVELIASSRYRPELALAFSYSNRLVQGYRLYAMVLST